MTEPQGGPVATPESNEAVVTELYPSGEALTAEAALDITRATFTRIIVIAGPADSGKTTLVASFYERFHDGPLAGTLFAGSKTLVGFERRCHLSRRVSGRETPHTERTKLTATDVLLHLTVRAQGGGPPQDLLFTDIYGDTFHQAANSTDEAEQLTVLRRADHVALLIDGAKLVDLKHRHEPYSQADALLASGLEVGVFGSESQVQVLITKMDKLGDPEQPNASLAFARDKWAWLRDRYHRRLGSLDKFEVAARHESPSLPPAYGLEDVFRLWVTRPRLARLKDRETPPRTRGPFDGFARAWAARKG